MSTATAQSLDPATAAVILSQFDQKTQLQALTMLRQLNAQQQLQQLQQLQQIQQLQTLQNLQRLHLKSSASGPSSGNSTSGQTTQQNSQSMFKKTENRWTSKNFGNTDRFAPVKKESGPDGQQFVVPSEELKEAIVAAAEFYFSDENLAKDHYLLRQICQKSEGFLSIKLLTALKSVKKLTKDWRVTSYALKTSTTLQLNEEFTKVKRVADLPEHVLKARSITNVIAIKIPQEFGSVSQITQLFSGYGKITLVRVLMPGRQVPCDLRNYATQVPDMGNTLCAVIEYETENEACNACRELNGKKMPSGLRAALLGPRLRRNLYKAENQDCDSKTTTSDRTPSDMGLGSSGGLSRTNSSDGKSSDNGVGNNPLSSWRNIVVSGPKEIIPAPKRADSGCDSASSLSQSPPTERKKINKVSAVKTFDKAPGAQRRSVKMQINISSIASGITRQPKGPSGCGFVFKRSCVGN